MAPGDAIAKLHHHPHPAKATVPTCQIYRKTNAGGPDKSARAIGDPGPCGRNPCSGRTGLGKLSRNWLPWQGEFIIDKPGKGSFYATDLDLVLKGKGNSQHYSYRHYQRMFCVHTTMRDPPTTGAMNVCCYRTVPAQRITATTRLH